MSVLTKTLSFIYEEQTSIKKEFWRIKQHWFWYNCWGNLDKFARKLVIIHDDQCIKSYKNLTFNSQNLGCLNFSLSRQGWVYGGNSENHPTHPSLDSPLKLVLWKFLFLSIQFDLLSNFYLFYCNNINKRTGEINNFLYWNVRDKRAPRKNNNGTVLSNGNQFA